MVFFNSGNDAMNRSVMLALGLSGLLTAWMLLGSAAQKEQTQRTPMKPLMKVVTASSVAKNINQKITLNGQALPNKNSALKAEIVAVVDKILVKEGMKVKKGESLLTFKMSDRLARLAEAKSKVLDEETSLKAMMHLSPQGFSAETKLYENKAELAKAKARLLGVQIEISKTQVVAPFDGIISEITVEEGDYLKPGDKVGSIINNNPLLIEAYLSQKDIDKVKINNHTKITLATGKTLLGHIYFISPLADKNSRMFKIESLTHNPLDYPAGMSAQMEITTKKIKAHFISPAQLSITMTGDIGIKTLDKNNVVHFQKVTIARSNSKGLWLTNLPDTITMVTVGQGFVEEGEKVIAINAGALNEKNH